MLNTDVKKQINTARDILVGKIPDPKGQIDQITNALIYKFMDDQDRLSQTLPGGKATFFVNELEPFAWHKLFDSKLSNQDRANLYVEGIAKLSKAKNLPDLFRDIFKDAFLPFRDADTIAMFLNVINKFDYHHSEDLGNAFEYLLSIMGSQGDAGQFRTPRNIIEFIVDAVDPTKDETILDPACGTAGFLVEAYKHITKEKNLSPNEVQELAKHINGVDIDPGMAKIARVNLYLHGFKTPLITEDDTLTNDSLWGKKYDVILANPPFMTPRGGIKPHDKFSVQSKRAEVLFTDYIAEHLKLAGRAGIVVPVGVVFQDQSSYIQLRKKIVEDNFLFAVISLPGGIFNPYSDAETNILLFDRKLSSSTSKILFLNVRNDGYSLGNTRTPIKENDLPEALHIIKNYQLFLNNKASEAEFNQTLEESNVVASLISKEKIANSKYILISDYYYGNTKKIDPEKLIALDKILFRKKEVVNIEDKETYKRITVKLYGKGIFERDEVIGKKIGTKRQFKVRSGQLLLSKIDARSGAFGIIPKELDGAIVTGNFWTFEIDTDKVNSDYLAYLLTSNTFYSVCKLASSGVTNRKYLNEDKFLAMKIELPERVQQDKIVTELNEYKSKILSYQEKLSSKITEIWG
jgi:type I restriction enzyme M protein